MTPAEVAERIRRSLPEASVTVRSADNTHFTARLVSRAFTGVSPVARHQMVYRALGESVGGEIHALSIEAFTPEEWERRGAADLAR